MSSFKKMLGLGSSEEKSQTSNRQTASSRAVSGEHSGVQSSAAQKASNLVPATIAERDDAEKDLTVCAVESEVWRLAGMVIRKCSVRLCSI